MNAFRFTPGIKIRLQSHWIKAGSEGWLAGQDLTGRAIKRASWLKSVKVVTGWVASHF
jgi:hypothetical protein